jgi:hypothetical protein
MKRPLPARGLDRRLLGCSATSPSSKDSCAMPISSAPMPLPRRSGVLTRCPGDVPVTLGWQGNRVRHDRELPTVPVPTPDGFGLRVRYDSVVFHADFHSQRSGPGPRSTPAARQWTIQEGPRSRQGVARRPQRHRGTEDDAGYTQPRRCGRGMRSLRLSACRGSPAVTGLG